VSFVRYNAIWKAASKNVEKAYNMVWEGEFKDSHLFLLALEDRNVQSEIASDCDYLLSDKLVRGFGVAVEHDFFCISAPNEPTSNIRLQGKKRELAKDGRSEEHTSELQSRENIVCRLLLEKKKTYGRRCFVGQTHAAV